MEFSYVAIFWLSFAAIIGPVFLIALICSIIKAVRTRKTIHRRMIENANREQDQPMDAEIITETPRRKPNFKLIEDEARKRQFRSKTGSLLYVNSNNGKSNLKYKDTDIDNRSHNHHSDAGTTSKALNGHKVIGGKVDSNKQRGNHAPTPSTSTSAYTSSSPSDSSSGNTNSSRRRRSYDEAIPSSSYARAIIDNTYQTGTRDSLHGGYDISHPGLNPNSYNTNPPRRHSINSISPTLERIPEVKCVEVEMNTTKSKSEDNLIEHQPSYPNSSPYLNATGYGSDNKGFARSTETTIM